MISNCGNMGLDWERLSLSGYLEALEAHNDAHSTDKKPQASPGGHERLKRAMDALKGE
ncbi:MAG: hypothetical protein ABFC96_07615 [Thermoguttaceae bacterium]